MLSVLAARAGAALWARRSALQDVVFADLTLWDRRRRVPAERRLAVASSFDSTTRPRSTRTSARASAIARAALPGELASSLT